MFIHYSYPLGLTIMFNQGLVIMSKFCNKV
jgi:hypothetical protein